ncbi:MAG: hypothetical protein LQ343_007463 [Gyalolechia ehrenbergii]|nr:MAG: hypothetical protein LQ343_007463 [Gyalolechia ehrenbergii]
MSVTSTDTVIAAPIGRSIQSLGSSYGTLSPPRQKNSRISKVYKQASASFLTRDFAEAFAFLQTILTPPEHSVDDFKADEPPEQEAPIATANRSLRIKVWSFYLTLLDAIIELGPEEGKAATGSKKWREISSKARDGSIWDEVVQIGYGGIEGNMDADVVANLATLLLSQSASQIKNQQHLETYLATSDVSRTPRPDQLSTNNTNTPHELASRIKILELYILHVLPANEEWDYAKDFIQMSDILDDEQKEAFQQALEDLVAAKMHSQQDKDDSTQDCDQMAETMKNTPQELRKAEPKPIEDTEHPPEHRRSNSEHDYGIEEKKPVKAKELDIKPPSRTGSKANQQRNSKPLPPKTSPRKPTGDGMIRRSVAFVAAFHNLISNMTYSLSKNPLAQLRFVLVLVALLVALSRRDVKDRIRRIARDGWDRVRRTIGMGVKVSYI